MKIKMKMRISDAKAKILELASGKGRSSKTKAMLPQNADSAIGEPESENQWEISPANKATKEYWSLPTNDLTKEYWVTKLRKPRPRTRRY